MFRSVAAVVIWLACTRAWAVGATEIRAAIAEYNAMSSVGLAIPIPGAKKMARLVDGHVVNHRLSIPNPNDPEAGEIYRVVGYIVVAQPRLLVWAATLATTTQHASRLTEIPIRFDDAGGALWYQYVALPWPLADRHWMIQTEKRVELANGTDQVVWEHSWSLAEDGLKRSLRLVASGKAPGIDEAAAARAVYLPANRGGWIMGRLDRSTTLVLVHATAELGGRLPDGWVARYVKGQLNHVLGRLEGRSRSIAAQFDGSGSLFSGAGHPVTRTMLVAQCKSLNEPRNEC